MINQVERLHKRGWLVRPQAADPVRYTAAVGRQKAARLLAGDFLDDFFDGSASQLVASLLGSRRLKAAEVERLRAILDRRDGREERREEREDKP